MKFKAVHLRRFLLGCAALLAVAPARAADRADIEAPRVTATLEQGLAVETGSGLQRNPRLAIKLYCEAGIMGSSEGYFRLARVLARGPAYLRNPPLANAYFALAARLGHHAAFEQFDRAVVSAPLLDDCRAIDVGPDIESFDLDGYLSALSPSKRKVAALIRRHAERYGIDVRIALAIALAESNLDAQAVSPKNAQGVMQLIPGTQERFGVTKPFDAEANIKGGLAYLRWLKARYAGDWERVAAAYNAGEGAVDRHDGIPPYRETQGYVRRVLFFAGFDGAGGI
ncbi:lytic transglycosylase domain-containing protein [Sulfuritalea sp.]|uniref:lytic transglycosylase domain-containing protein n=1 Tax=Sulfuritalea sp. TaxID=2480090 RepID=UPI00286D777E|nr:lytic transglycosylase domain-containing protein [Sulfuritalea sp.]